MLEKSLFYVSERGNNITKYWCSSYSCIGWALQCLIYALLV